MYETNLDQMAFLRTSENEVCETVVIWVLFILRSQKSVAQTRDQGQDPFLMVAQAPGCV